MKEITYPDLPADAPIGYLRARAFIDFGTDGYADTCLSHAGQTLFDYEPINRLPDAALVQVSSRIGSAAAAWDRIHQMYWREEARSYSENYRPDGHIVHDFLKLHAFFGFEAEGISEEANTSEEGSTSEEAPIEPASEGPEGPVDVEQQTDEAPLKTTSVETQNCKLPALKLKTASVETQNCQR